MKRHATEDDDGPLTLCGAYRASVHVDNAVPDCGRCLRSIRARCDLHNVKRCKVCSCP